MGETFNPQEIRPWLQELAARQVFLGTSSWKYLGWCDQLYDRARYVYRGSFAEKRFEKLCLAEYAEIFPSVCVDAAYYRFPTRTYLEDLAASVPADFRFSFKVTDEITLKKFTRLPRFGVRAGKVNENFLNAELFRTAFLLPLESIRAKTGVLMFEFSRFYPTDFARGQDFVEALEKFLAGLPAGWDYGVEIRNPAFLHPEYFATLTRHQVAHVYNSWEGMPPVSEQLNMPGSLTSETVTAARFLLAPGRKYEEAVARFSPYDRVQEVNEPARQAGADLIQQTLNSGRPRRAYIYVNNRLEGNALHTIRAMVDRARGWDGGTVGR